MITAVRACELLESVYGRPKCKPAHEPLDELVLTILSQATTAANYTRAFESLRKRFASWDGVREADVADIEDAIKSGGLAKMKAPRIKALLEEIHARRGELSLSFLADMSSEDGRNYLMSFRGVGIKTASCVLLFSLCRPVFPVDTHVCRVSKRLALIGEKVSAEEAHIIMRKMIPDDLVYSFHINLVNHGRKVCRARNPLCDACVLLPECPWGQRAMASGGF